MIKKLLSVLALVTVGFFSNAYSINYVETIEEENIIDKTPNLEFRLEATPRTSHLRKEEFNFKNHPDRSVFLENEIIVSGDNIIRATMSVDENGAPQINIELDQDGAKAMAEATQRNIGRNLGVVLIEEITKTSIVAGKDIEEKWIVAQVISYATIQDVLGAKIRISGLGSTQEARDLALQLNVRALEASKKARQELKWFERYH
tara:strand:+ start:2727 stop:3338 length:612 start_codon:yes stop_codon:yes gene_type:complete